MVEGRLVEGTGTLIGGFGAGLSPEREDLEARDGRGTGPAGFRVALRTSFASLLSETSDLG